MNVVIIGASNKPERYSHRAQRMLTEHGHQTFPISVSGNEIQGRTGFRSILEIPEVNRPIHTVTVYLSPDRFASIVEDVAAVRPNRVIFNPGTESAEAVEILHNAGIRVVEACTLVLLSIGQFESA